ncbi:MAG: hypothetical protein QOE47_81 [Pyrinomonadaceae bacterium]|nr:hypothetical protein [Pyrinomonadaceae bacterium]
MRFCSLLVFPLLLLQVTSVTATPKVKSGIRSIDFRNFTYPFECDETKTVTLRQGTVPESRCYGITKVVSVHYHDFDGDGQEEALVVLGTNCQTSCWYIENYYVYSYHKGHYKLIFQESQGYRYKLGEPADFGKDVWTLGQPYGVSINRGRLQITGLAHYDGDANCCPRFRERTVYGWRRNRFAVIARKRSLDPNGPGDPLTRQ